MPCILQRNGYKVSADIIVEYVFLYFKEVTGGTFNFDEKLGEDEGVLEKT